MWVSAMPDSVPLRWRMVRAAIWMVIARASRRQLAVRQLVLTSGERIRWLRPEIEAFLAILREELDSIRDDAGLSGLPDTGSRLMGELALFTIAAGIALRRCDVEMRCARIVVADLGWLVYRRLLLIASLPARSATRDPRDRLRATIRALLFFPFRDTGAPGYAVDVFEDDEGLHTHFRHCPPQSLARAVAARRGDPEILETFRSSWCIYDWPGADLIVGDTQRGHYKRMQTLSHGDPLCDMCWSFRANGTAAEGAATLTEEKGRT